MIRRWRFGALLSYFITGVTSRSLYNRYLQWLVSRRDTPLVVRRVLDFEMILDLSDPGLSKELLLFGTREEKLAMLFEQHIKDLCRRTVDPVVIDVGANIGFYTILEANAMDDGRIMAIEPFPRNMELCRANLALNGCEDRVSLHECAIGSTNETGRLHLSASSNRHRILTEAERANSGSAGIDVPMYTLDSFVTEHGVDPGDVSVVRMDLEGFELEVLNGMTDILASDGPTLLYIEVHPLILDEVETSEVIAHLRDNGFEIAAVECGTITWAPFDFTLDVDSFDQLSAVDLSYGLIVRK